MASRCHGHHRWGVAGLLGALAGLGCLLFGGWRPWQRSSDLGFTAGVDGERGCDPLSAGGWPGFYSSGSNTGGAGVPCQTSSGARSLETTPTLGTYISAELIGKGYFLVGDGYQWTGGKDETLPSGGIQQGGVLHEI